MYQAPFHIKKPVVIWCLCILIRCLFWYEISNLLWITIIWIDMLLLFFGIFLAVASLILLYRRRSRRKNTVFAILITAFIVIRWITPYGQYSGIYFRFWRNSYQYEQVVNEIIKGTPEEECRPRPYRIDKGPPMRVAFLWGGIVDNWNGIIYDPTGYVLKANQLKRDFSNWDDPEMYPVRMLFGGELYYAKHLGGNWYFCLFT